MLKPRLIACLDVRDGRVVKGVRFENLRDSGDPASLAARYEREGADEIVVLDVSATREGRAAAANTVRAIRRSLGIPLIVGGGVRSELDASELLEAGADKVAINSASVADPTLLTRLAERFGRQCVVQAIDARRTNDGRWTVVTHAGTRPTSWDAADFASVATGHGAGELLVTSMDRDGTGSGYDLDLLREIARRVHVPVIASGGGRTPAQLRDALVSGAAAVLVASILHDGGGSVGQLKRGLAELGIAMRMEEAA
jgi:imidazoleglycerol phosphate synthase cyclase subunit